MQRVFIVIYAQSSMWISHRTIFNAARPGAGEGEPAHDLFEEVWTERVDAREGIRGQLDGATEARELSCLLEYRHVEPLALQSVG